MNLLTPEETMRFKQVIELDGIVETLRMMLKTVAYTEYVRFAKYALDAGMITSDELTGLAAERLWELN